MSSALTRLIRIHPENMVAARAPEFGVAIAPIVEGFIADDWPGRVEMVEEWLSRLVDVLQDGSETEQRASAVRARTILTALLEAVPGVQIECLDSAVLVHLSICTPWRLAACRWLADVENAALEEWLSRHPGVMAVLACTTMATAVHA